MSETYPQEWVEKQAKLIWEMKQTFGVHSCALENWLEAERIVIPMWKMGEKLYRESGPIFLWRAGNDGETTTT